jgi:hypothetical protein
MNPDLLVEEIEQQTGPIAGFTNLGQYRRDINQFHSGDSFHAERKS